MFLPPVGYSFLTYLKLGIQCEANHQSECIMKAPKSCPRLKAMSINHQVRIPEDIPEDILDVITSTIGRPSGMRRHVEGRNPFTSGSILKGAMHLDWSRGLPIRNHWISLRTSVDNELNQCLNPIIKEIIKFYMSAADP
ncbi:hypothetical protein BJV82DRAFT_582882 [Fennellomyces sp. T-0311]|nr:hypothetical protein BJV82DRAFT_582882 [Fennellomyces sp. T-0311]